LKLRAVPDTSFLIAHFRNNTVQEAFLNLTKYYHVTFSSVVLMELLAGAFDPRERVKGLLADILIAVSVRDIGAVLITRNEKDFRLIRDVCDFKYIVVE